MLYFYTVTSPEQIHLCNGLKQSLARFGHELSILPLYSKNNFSKLNITYVLQTTEYNDDDIIVVCDGFDVVCCTNPDKIETYMAKNKDTVDILISSENMFGNNMVCIKEYYDKYNEKCGTSGKYLNSGVIIGRANKLKQFYSDIYDNVEIIRKQYIPADRQENTGDQTFIIDYLYLVDFMGNNSKLPYKVCIDVHDELTFTNTVIERKYNIMDYVFIHTWGIYIADPSYKYIRDQQYKKWCDINSQLKIDVV